MSRLRRLVAERRWIFATTAASGFAYAALASRRRVSLDTLPCADVM
jgi:hypothetical protein